ncbi:MAG: HEPN domain-containing protein [Methylovulum sp.]|uniref:HEPN domain-containing protein n=1 Tax=Methylovulum sp. TaxID=1916980 RepID=UPI002610FFA8|nr:HEPN domain-containing protein [Methylovulum sp.]MDD2723704.1 HEPN domain-containing protein [Methylovulum sp.]MDD5123322.1 HEPN domain-containing protein [Methylovulum sp.]
MDNFLLKTELAVENCKNHLRDTNSLESPIEHYLTQYLSIIFCAEMEETVKRLFDESVRQKMVNLNDEELKGFINNQLERLKASSLKKADLADYVKHFSDQAKQRFNSHLQEKDREITIYSNVITSRHRVAHTSRPNNPNQLTLPELEQAVEAAREILKAVQIALQSNQ